MPARRRKSPEAEIKEYRHTHDATIEKQIVTEYPKRVRTGWRFAAWHWVELETECIVLWTRDGG